MQKLLKRADLSPRPGLKLQRMSVIGSIPGLLLEPGPPQNDEDIAWFSRLLKAVTKQLWLTLLE